MEHDLIKGGRIGVDASTIEANAARRSIVRRDSGEGCWDMLKRMAAERGIETSTAEALMRLDCAREGKRLSYPDWALGLAERPGGEARQAEGRPHPADLKPEHAVDLDTGAIVAATIHPADRGDTTTLPGTLQAAAACLAG